MLLMAMSQTMKMTWQGKRKGTQKQQQMACRTAACRKPCQIILTTMAGAGGQAQQQKGNTASQMKS